MKMGLEKIGNLGKLDPRKIDAALSTFGNCLEILKRKLHIEREANPNMTQPLIKSLRFCVMYIFFGKLLQQKVLGKLTPEKWELFTNNDYDTITSVPGNWVPPTDAALLEAGLLNTFANLPLQPRHKIFIIQLAIKTCVNIKNWGTVFQLAALLRQTSPNGEGGINVTKLIEVAQTKELKDSYPLSCKFDFLTLSPINEMFYTCLVCQAVLENRTDCCPLCTCQMRE
eukprot:TRINITY_DN16378_c0_g1_i3.p1 TRINITY_DN16378_c0_g1~~TRINITY_DN16378_c0_g1_i3.p1  ORF type:complete len:227 (-),score=35.39 TRINITY_DN16378_c0_g1_i3:82-762(-)